MLEAEYSNVIAKLDADKIAFHFGDETVMAQLACVEGKTLRIGEFVYDKVIIPFCETLDRKTVELLHEYLDNGGRLCMLYDAPTRVDGKIHDLGFLKSNLSYDEIKDSQGVRIKHGYGSDALHIQTRVFDGKRIIFITNTSADEYVDVEITVKDCNGLAGVDVKTLTAFPMRGKINSDGSVSVLYDFGESGSCVLIESDTELLSFTPSAPQRVMSLEREFDVCGNTENMLTLDTAAVSLNGSDFTDIRPIVRIKDNLLKERFEGAVSLRYYFTVDELPKSLVFVCEPMRYTSIKVNGKSSTFDDGWRFDRSFCVSDLTDTVHIGENYVELTFDYFQSDWVYTVLYGGGNEALRNCLAFDTEIESAYLFGDFAVSSRSDFVEDAKNSLRTEGPFAIKKRKETVDITNIVSDGYPFFAGTLTVQKEFFYRSGEPTLLKLDGRFSACKIRLNGKPINTSLFQNTYELAEHLVKGNNKLEIDLCTSNRNLLGPHHAHDPEPRWVAPRTFSFEKDWNGDECKNYEYRYSFVKQGLFV